MSLYVQIKKNISDVYKNFINQTSAQYSKKTVFGVIISVGLISGYFAYNFYVKQREQKAFGALIEIIDSFERAKYEIEDPDADQDKNNKINIWQDTEILIDALYKQNSHSYLAPYFLIFKSQVELERGTPVDDVIKNLSEALNKIPKDSAIFDSYNLKRILMSFDSKDENIQKEALNELISITKNEKSYSFEQASYMLGLYYISQNNTAQAREIFENLLKSSDKKALLPSPWIKQAEEKLESIKFT